MSRFDELHRAIQGVRAEISNIGAGKCWSFKMVEKSEREDDRSPPCILNGMYRLFKSPHSPQYNDLAAGYVARAMNECALIIFQKAHDLMIEDMREVLERSKAEQALDESYLDEFSKSYTTQETAK